ncbi:urotensin-2B isoform X1 [Mesocricetus auratus]|uniref:Urotensin-2B isoform X1 n=1 Tax=Mesocricetus auratus TaxID=10036 RepID=A0A3Q0CMD2_MESAU|nr:urotensin-2B isoform X1 [Mesocricetus auratus]
MNILQFCTEMDGISLENFPVSKWRQRYKHSMEIIEEGTMECDAHSPKDETNVTTETQVIFTMKIFSASLCFGLLALLSVIDFLKYAHGWPHLSSGQELFPANQHAIHEKLLLALLRRNPSFQRPSHPGVDLPSKPEHLRQLKEGFMEAKNAKLSNTIDTTDDNLSSPHPNKRACFWKYCV